MFVPTLMSYSFCSAALRAPDAAVCLRLLLLAPLLEELVVRAGLQEWLIRRAATAVTVTVTVTVRRASGPMAPMAPMTPAERTPIFWMMPALPLLGSAVAFGLLHLRAGVPAALAVTAPGLLLAMLYQRTRDWRLCAAGHSLMNASALMIC